MIAALSRTLMAMAAGCMGDGRRDWANAMAAEYEAAAAEGAALRFAAGCLLAAWRDMIGREEGHFILTNYALVLGLMVPMAAVQIGCALLGLPYLYPPAERLPVTLMDNSTYDGLMHSVYLGGVPSFTLMLLVLGGGHLRLAWAMLERDWNRVTRVAAAMVAAVATLVLVMSAFFLDSSQALLQGAVVVIELATVAGVARWHAQLGSAPVMEQTG